MQNNIQDVGQLKKKLAVAAVRHLKDDMLKIKNMYKVSQFAMEDNEKYRTVLNNVKEVIFQTNADGLLNFLNPAWEEVTGFSTAESIGKSLSDYVHPKDRQSFGEIFESLAIAHNEYFRYETRFITKGKRFRWGEIFACLTLNEQCEIVGISGTLNDITERKANEHKLKEHHDYLEKIVTARTRELRKINEQLKWYKLLAENVRDIMLFIRSDGHIIEANNAAVNVYGYSRKELLSMKIQDLSMSTIVNEHMVQAFSENILFETLHRRKDGSAFYVEVSSQSAQFAEDKVLLSVIRDVTERKHFEQQLHYLATHDCLTNINNRYALEKSLKEVIKKADTDGKSALLLIDLDNFKLVNDTYGHAAGDQLLVNFCSFLKQHIREKDMLARIGGDEFAVLLNDADVKEAKCIAEELCQALNKNEFTVNYHGCQVNLTASIGIVTIDGTSDVERSISFADIALYAAKDEGRNRVVVIHSAEDKARVSRDSHMVELIKSAVKENRFTLFFQPIIKIGKEVMHYEALIRMLDKDGRIIPPNEFLPIAERFGLMSQIDRWVIKTVLSTLQRCNMKIFVNLSGLSLGDKALLDYIEDSIKQSGINPSSLGFEITETTAVKDIKQAEMWIRRIKSIGCEFALDDFGVGFSSFSYLQKLSVDYLKIDGSFIRNADVDPTQRALVKAINAVAHSLGKETIAEFVENRSVLDMLENMQVDYGQGYYIGKPLPLSEIAKVV